MNADEAGRRQAHVAKLREFFEARPLAWVPAAELEDEGGRQAWRTRVSELRKQFEREDAGTIENRLTYRNRCVVLSEYRYLPHQPTGRDSTRPTPALPLFDDGPWSQR